MTTVNVFGFIPGTNDVPPASPKEALAAAAEVVTVETNMDKDGKLVYVCDENEPGPHNGGVRDTSFSYIPG